MLCFTTSVCWKNETGDIDKMSGPTEQPSERYQASSLLVGSRPNEIAFPLREDEFQTLSEGELSDARSSRDLCIGILITAAVGLAGLLALVDWEISLKPEHRVRFLCWMSLLIAAVAGSFVGVLIHQLRMVRASTKSPYYRLKMRITEWFTEASHRHESISEGLTDGFREDMTLSKYRKAREEGKI